jgi:pimeloyl-ACP methyl ester carboxylesterase
MTIPMIPLETVVQGGILRGMAYLPDAGSGRFPVAVLHHGFGSNRIESGILPHLGRELAGSGIAAICFDRPGQGESDGDFFRTTPSIDINAAKQLLEVVAGLDFVDADNIHLMGMSFGSVIASTVAAESGVAVRSLTMWSTAASFVDEISGGTLQGMPLDVLDTVGYLDFYGVRLGPDMIEESKTFDVYGRVAGYRGPALLLHGTADFIPVSYAERYLSIFGEESRLIVVPGADHGWAQVPNRHRAVTETVSFIGKHAKECA